MTSILCATLVQAAVLLTATEAKETETENYAQARQATLDTGKPMVVMVSTEWCPPCQTMKKTILPRVREHGVLRKVVFAQVNPDKDGKLAEEITGGGPIPQLVMFRKTREGWVRKKLVGGQSVEDVEKFINDGVAMAAAETKPTGDTPKEQKQPTAPASDHAAYSPEDESRKGSTPDNA